MAINLQFIARTFSSNALEATSSSTTSSMFFSDAHQIQTLCTSNAYHSNNVFQTNFFESLLNSKSYYASFLRNIHQKNHPFNATKNVKYYSNNIKLIKNASPFDTNYFIGKFKSLQVAAELNSTWNAAIFFIGNRQSRLVNFKNEPPFLFRAKNENNEVDSDYESFWEKPEGRKKLQEIEELKTLMADLENLQKSIAIDEMVGDSNNQGKTIQALEEEKGNRLREMLAKKAKELAEKRKESEKLYKLGQKAYERGVYDKAVEILELSLSKIDSGSILGGEIQIWLAMAYDANGKNSVAIEIYKNLENIHPNIAIRRQAKDLRYIMEAPKLKLSKDEMVTLPILDADNNSSDQTWSQMVQEKRAKNRKKNKKSQKSYLDDWNVWERPRWEESPYFWVAVSVWSFLVIFSLYFQ